MHGIVHSEALTSECLVLLLDHSEAVGQFLLKQIKGRQVNANCACKRALVPATIPTDQGWEGCKTTSKLTVEHVLSSGCCIILLSFIWFCFMLFCLKFKN